MPVCDNMVLSCFTFIEIFHFSPEIETWHDFCRKPKCWGLQTLTRFRVQVLLQHRCQWAVVLIEEILPIHVQFAQFKKNLLWWKKLPTPWLAIMCLLDKSTGGTRSHHHLRLVSQNGLSGTMRLDLPLQEVKCLLVPASLLLSLLNTIHLGPQTRGVLWINIATLPPSCKKQK